MRCGSRRSSKVLIERLHSDDPFIAMRVVRHQPGSGVLPTLGGIVLLALACDEILPVGIAQIP